MFTVLTKKNDFLQASTTLNTQSKTADNQYNFKVFTTKIQADLITPIIILQNLENNQKYTDKIFFYESVITDSIKGRYSIIAFDSNLEYKINDNIFQTMQNFVDNINIDKCNVDLPNFVGSLFFYLTYKSGFEKNGIKNNLTNLTDTINIPNCILSLPKFVIFFDKVFDTAYISKICGIEETFNDVLKEIDSLTKTIYNINFNNISSNNLTNSQNINNTLSNIYNKKHIVQNSQVNYELFSNITQDEYKKSVEISQQYITNGDCFQVVPSLRLVKFLNKDYSTLNFYRRLRNTNPSPFMFYIKNTDLHNNSFCITGASPEIMVRLKDNAITIKPLAGTRKKTGNDEIDKKIAQELLSDAKEISEHLILLDLGRNDVGSVAEYQSVYCEKKMEVEFYSHVMHISSTVKGVRSQNANETDILLAGMPAGTVSGGPKKRAMEVINEIESIERSFYSGTLGYISKNILESCIILRTALIKDGVINIQAGAGVVFDSNPESEYQECINKMLAVIKAI